MIKRTLFGAFVGGVLLTMGYMVWGSQVKAQQGCIPMATAPGGGG